MWLRVLLWCSWSVVWAQNTVIQDGGQWGWQMSSAGPETIGHYYVKLPQAEQMVRYVADGGGYHGALALVSSGPGASHTASFALGQRAIELAQLPFYQQSNNSVEPAQAPVDVYLLQPTDQIYQEVPYNVQLGSTDLYPDSHRNPFYINVDQNKDSIERNYEKNKDIVKVFKDKSCLNDDHKQKYEKQKTDFYVDSPEYKEQSVNGNFGVREQTLERTTSRSDRERIQYSTELSPSTTLRTVSFTEDEGISRLVASTQDLVSNDDLVRINHAAEKFTSAATEDFIRPQRKLKNIDRKNRFLVTAKFGNINDQESNGEVSRPQNDHKFASPIVVEDFSFNNYKEQLVNNLQTTVGPYIENGYEIVGVKSTFENVTNNRNYDDEVSVTPRPVGPNYLTPITVALRLLNSNDSDVYNSLEDHESADSEFVANTVESPEQQRVIVEIQKSIPLDITHINEVEYHEYMDEGRSNTESPLGLVKSLYQKYMASLNADNINNDYKDSKTNDYDTNENENSKEEIESSENIRSEVQVQATDKGNGYNYYDENVKDKIIQPIVIEKQVPITTFVNRFIEKEVPYPEPYEVVKHVPVDRPVPVPVHFERIVEKPVEVTRYVDKPYPVEVLQPFPVEVRVPYPVEHKVYVDRPVHIPVPVEKVVEKQMIHPVPVPTPVAIPVGIEVPVEKKVLYPIGIQTPVPYPVPYEKQVPVEKVVEKQVPVPYAVEKRVPYPVPHEVQVPVPYPVEKRVPYPVEKIVEKPVQVTKVVEKPVHIKVPQPVPIEVPRPYPVDRIVEKKVPYPVHVERIVEKNIPVQVPYPVKVEKIVDKPVYITKYVDRPFPVEKRVPYPVEKIVEKKVPYPVEVPVEVRVSYSEKNKKSDQPYQFEKIEPAYLYAYGLGYTQNYLRPQYKQNYNNQAAESQRNYQIQPLNDDQKNSPNVPIQSTLWGNQYATSFQYLNATENKKPLFVPNSNYYGPPPLKNDQWNANDRVRKSDRTPKVANLRIEYGFKPPLIPSTEVDLDGVPVNKQVTS